MNDLQITDVVYNSSRVKPGCCFVAISGTARDGHQFIPMAVHAGAKVVVSQYPVQVPMDVTNVVVEDSRDALARISADYFSNPSRELNLVGVTGTNGKTTITYLLESIWRAAHRSPGVMGTINCRFSGMVEPVSHTTPESYELQRLLRHMRNHQVSDVVMEVSSHALTQSRVVACQFDGAIFTNLTQDHLDYHRNMEDYFEAKGRLFRERLVVTEKQRPWGVVNWDDPYGRRLTENLGFPIYRYSLKDRVEIYPSHLSVTTEGIRMKVASPKGVLSIQSGLRAHFNVSNILASVAAALFQGISISAIEAGVAALARVPGRLDPAAGNVFVDYAHTPDALLHVCKAMKAITRGRLITVFGCGGDRDRSKRPLMGEIAAKHSDVVVVTSDNPRTEDPVAIIQAILGGVHRADLKSSEHCIVEPDRKKAIFEALKLAQAGDVVLIAGKGHEDYQIVGSTKHHFDDREVVQEYYERKSLRV